MNNTKRTSCDIILFWGFWKPNSPFVENSPSESVNRMSWTKPTVSGSIDCLARRISRKESLEFSVPISHLACILDLSVLENSSKLLNFARDSGCTIIHAPISFEPGHDEISESCYGILAGVKEGSAFTKGEWGADFAGTKLVRCAAGNSFQI